jgi:chromosome segregation ATPase
MQMSSQQKYERAQASLKGSREELQELEAKLADKQKDLSEAIVAVETSTGQKARRDRLAREVENLEGRIRETQQSVAALEQALPGLRKAAKLEGMAEREVPLYQAARDTYINALAAAPDLEGLKTAIAAVAKYVSQLQEAQEDFQARAQGLNSFLLRESLDRVGNMSTSTLREDQAAIDSGPLSNLLDELVESREELEGVEETLLDTVNSARIAIIEPAPEDITEVCPCGLHRLEYKGRERLWRLFETTIVGTDLTGGPVTKTIELGRGTTKPEWPCHEPKPVPKPQHVGNLLGEPGLPLRAPGSDAVTNKEEAHE